MLEIGTSTTSLSQKDLTKRKEDYNPVIVLPGRELKNRIPGSYPDIPTKEKAKNNISILHACKLLQAFNKSDGITALVLDGKEMRTTNTLESLGDILKGVNIVEYNNQTYERMLNKKREKKINKKIHCHNCHIKEYIDDLNDPNTNVAYFDIMSTLFSSEKSFGSDIIIHEFLRQSEEKEIVLAATFCLRNSAPQSYKIQQNKILLLLGKIFAVNGYKAKILLPKNKLRYKGQNTGNKSMMFVLFFLEKEENEEKVENDDKGEKKEKYCGSEYSSEGSNDSKDESKDGSKESEEDSFCIGFKKEKENNRILELEEDESDNSENENEEIIKEEDSDDNYNDKDEEIKICEE